jgi:hypothetical protein
MSEDKNNENEFERDFSESNEEETTLNEDTSDLIEEEVLETNDESSTNGSENPEKEIDPIAEANESLITMDPAPFDRTLEIMSQTLASIDNKMDIENSQLQKLDQLSEIKDQLNRLENISVATATSDTLPEQEITSEISPENEDELPQNNMGHNQQEISELLEKIEILERKILAIENQSNDSNSRFEKIESVVERFEDLESEIHIEYEEDEKVERPNLFKNLFKKKNNTEPYKKNTEINSPEIQLREIVKDVPKNTKNIIEQAEASLKNSNSEIIINDNIEDESEKSLEQKKSKGKNILLSMLLILIIGIATIFILDGFRIIDSNFPVKIIPLSGLIDILKNIF